MESLPLRPCQFRLPDLLLSCSSSLKDAINPYFKDVAAESQAWINSYNFLTDRKRAFFMQGQSELLCSHVFSYAGPEEFRTTCDFVNLLFILDETSDEQSGSGAQATGEVFVNTMKYAKWEANSTISKITKDFRARFMKTAGGNNARRFFDLCVTFTQAVGLEAKLREQGRVLGFEEFIPHRRHNSGVLLCFALVEYILGIDLEDNVYEDATFADAYWAACDYVCWSNDLYSYDLEQSAGLMGSNVVTVLMQERGISLQEAVDYVGVHCNDLLDTYLMAREKLSQTLGPEASQFIYSLGQWMIGNIVWSFETFRYFGARHLEVKETRLVTISPRQPVYDDDCECSDED